MDTTVDHFTPLALRMRGNEPANIKKDIKRLFPQLNEETSVFRPTWISKLSTTYKVNSFVIIGSNGLDPFFGRIEDFFGHIEDFFVISDFVVFLVSIFDVLYFDDHYHTYAISLTSGKSVISLSELPDYNVYHSHKLLDGTDYITLKHYFLS